MIRDLEHTESTRELHDLLVQRYDEAYEEWTRQDAVVHAMRGDLDTRSGDEVDRTTVAAQLDGQDALARSLRRQLDDLAIAVDRGEQGRYGRCDSCGAAIPDDRMDLCPAASLCPDCERSPEQRESGRA